MDMAMFPPKTDLQNHTTDLTWPMGYSLLIPGSSDKTFFLHMKQLFLTWFTICRFVAAESDKAMVPHSSILAWRIPGMGGLGGLLSMGSHRVGHD